ncbi:sensor histidine kinase [Oceanotoga sp. DSM 15011]|uniref:sensor histidine kinase n=1 Tax=Oceanotoga sp. DSM 15011 TaxID=2984951 RepID=UPI0021F4E01B|nr:sensor histidine kinase [Oceanotoga sp. DSM 15011]UYO99613.1 sensor histidine kinase [Oceanotoga sp. DSM 15011]
MNKKIFFYGITIRLSIYAALIFSLIEEYHYFPNDLIKYLIIVGFIFVNDIFRYMIKSRRVFFIISFIFSIIISVFLTAYVSNDFLIYFFFLTYEFIIDESGIYSFLIGIFHFLSFTYIWLVNSGMNLIKDKNIFELIIYNSTDFFTNIFIYFVIVAILFLIKRLINERNKVMKLNEKLKNSLEEIEILTIQNERNRLAQEIHDSIGHSIAGLIMHLDYLEKIYKNNSKEVESIIEKSQNLARNSMKDLRKAVNTLKEDLNINNLQESIENLIENVSTKEKVIEYIFDGNIENMNQNIKYTVFRISQELITNSLKHSKGSKIYLYIKNDGDFIEIKESDNGFFNGIFEKGNGLKGIEKRVKSVNGEVIYDYEKNFSILIKIPLEGVYNDKSYDC